MVRSGFAALSIAASCSAETPLPMTWNQTLASDAIARIDGRVGVGPFVVGDAIWEQRSGGWRTVTVPGNGWRAVSVEAPDNIWVVGSGGQTAHRGPGGWGIESFGTGHPGLDVITFPDAAWSPVSYGEIMRNDGAGWASWTPPALGNRHTGVVWGSASDDVWLHAGLRSTGKPPELGHWDGTVWSFHRLSRSGYIADLHGRSPSDVWAVGWTVKWIGQGPLVARWDGTAWKEPQIPMKRRLNAVFADTNGVTWLAGRNGTLLRHEGDRFEILEGPSGDLTAIYAEPGDRIYVVADGKRLYEAPYR